MLLWNTLQKKAATVPVLGYLLKATWNSAADQNYTDAQVLNSASLGVEDGSLTVVEVDGTLSVVSNEMSFTAQSTPSWGDLGVYDTDGQTVLLGLTLLCDINMDVDDKDALIGFYDAGGMALTDRTHLFFFPADSQLQAQVIDGAGSVIENPDVFIYAGSTDYTCAIVLGGFDINGTPYYSGQTKSNYKYGAWFLMKGGLLSDWNALWVTSSVSVSSVYAAFSNYNQAGTLDNFKVPDSDLSAIQEAITNFSSFTGSDGTLLPSITPEVGGSWTDQAGTWKINTNAARNTSSVVGQVVSTVESGESDFIIKVDMIIPSPVGNYAPRLIGRYSDTSNYWAIEANENNDEFRIRERSGGSFTLRASSSVTIDQNITYNAVSVFDGQTITAYLDGGNRIAYGSATLNETSTVHGIGNNDGANPSFDNFMIFPRTSTAYNILDTV